MTIEAIERLVLTLVVAYFWTDNILRCYREWNAAPTPESFRAFLYAFVFEMGMATFLVAGLAVIWPDNLIVVSRFFVLMTTGALLVVGIWVWALRRPKVIARLRRLRRK